MASEFASRLITKTSGWSLHCKRVAIADTELQEVRECLLEVVREHDDPMSDYGCTTHATERARAMLTKLEIK